MGEGNILIISIAILFVIGGIVPLVVGTFYELEEVTPDGVYGGMVDFINDGFTIFTFDIDILGFLGDDTKTFITDQIKGYYLFAQDLPLIANAIIILIFLSIFYALIKALPTT